MLPANRRHDGRRLPGIFQPRQQLPDLLPQFGRGCGVVLREFFNELIKLRDVVLCQTLVARRGESREVSHQVVAYTSENRQIQAAMVLVVPRGNSAELSHVRRAVGLAQLGHHRVPFEVLSPSPRIVRPAATQCLIQTVHRLDAAWPWPWPHGLSATAGTAPSAA